ncbi:DUF4286 family protein [Bergeyella sp. RCAD1439]|uniref:DUF4286 family protein n=1 Tax=Bergeyella anatis TaxID=3113737 RepID=UPI002E19A312|nr:DUF4286 family protein [Bergeyella sp. RCAD1439]
MERILSLTFHAMPEILSRWENYAETELLVLVDNLMDVDKYILSEVYSEMITEGKNMNLLLVFDSEQIRNQFIESELVNITERIASEFGDQVMVFETLLNPKKIRL